MKPINVVLEATLQVAVPLWVEELRALAPEERAARAQEAALFIAAHGDDLQFGGPHCREAFNRLAEGLALLSFQPGGVRFAGLHFEVLV